MDAGQNGGAADGHHAAVVEILGQGVFDDVLSAGHFHGRQKLAVGKLRQAFGLAAYADEIFYVIVPGLDVFVTDGPIGRDAVAEIGFEIEIAEAIALAAPHDGLAADLAAANPGKRLAGIGGVGIFEIVDEKFGGILVASVVALALDFLRFDALVAIIPAAIFQLPGGDVLDVIHL